MSKKLVVKVGEYTDAQGQQKSRWQNVGVMNASNDGGEYILLDPHVSLAAVMQSQNVLAANKGEQLRDSIFEDDNQQQQAPHQQQQAPQQRQQNNQQRPPQRQQQPAPNYDDYGQR